MTVLNFQLGLMLIVQLVLLAVKILAFVNSLMWSPQFYTAAGKLTKPTWNIILGLGVVTHLFLPIMLLNLVFIVAALVYLVDVRPAMASLTRR